jgi:hypothetical protein
MKNKIVIKEKMSRSLWDALCLSSLLFLGLTFSLGKKILQNPFAFSSLDLVLIGFFYAGLGYLLYLILNAQSKIELGKEKIKIKSHLSKEKKVQVKYDEIENVNVFSNPIVSQYLGLGISFYSPFSLNRIAISKKGIQLEKKSGEKLLIQTSQPERLLSELEYKLLENKVKQ